MTPIPEAVTPHVHSHLRTCDSISCVVPAWNEADNLAVLLPALSQQLAALCSRWEMIVVDDGSTDHTAELLQRWLAAAPVRYLRLSRNFGKEAALTAGLARAGGDVVITLDADMQHPPELLPQMLQAWQRGADMVCAVRADRRDVPWWKRMAASSFFRFINSSSRVHIRSGAGDFRLMDRRVVNALNQLPERNRFMKGLYAWVGFQTEYIEFTPAPRGSGQSRFSSRRLQSLALTGITSFSTLPLRICGALGAVIAMGALVYGAWIVGKHLIVGHDVPGWATLVTSLMFFSGVQLLFIGVLGEYVGRIFEEVKQRPVYLVQEDFGQGLGIQPPQGG
jgi:glycosyltransferase involved in cell wall biosynthesis